jgi:dolichyl-phosphate-mannose-protein mannosyltransferase
MIENGAVIRLQHVITEKRVHSHDVRAPVTEVDWQNEVSGYGFPGFEGDANDFFRVEIVKKESAKGVARERLRYVQFIVILMTVLLILNSVWFIL